MITQIYACLWSDGQAKEMAEHYCAIFKNSKITAENPIVVKFEINGTTFMALNGGPKYKFSPANSYVIECDTQA
jgi:predicted 3-demethylubiquinone-9 3-methyltransferase (glyoxalase superfamily)